MCLTTVYTFTDVFVLIFSRSCAWVHVWKAVLPNLLFGREEGCSLRWSYVSTVLKIILRILRLKNDSDRISAQRVWNVRHLDEGFSVSKPEFISLPWNFFNKKWNLKLSGLWIFSFPHPPVLHVYLLQPLRLIHHIFTAQYLDQPHHIWQTSKMCKVVHTTWEYLY